VQHRTARTTTGEPIADWFASNGGVLWFLEGLIVAGLVAATFVVVIRHPP